MCKSCTKVKYTCGDAKYNANCVYVDKDILPKWSVLQEEDCVVVHEVLDELYSEIGNLSLTNVDLNNGCLEYDLGEENKLTQSIINSTFDREICELKRNQFEGNLQYCDSLDLEGLFDDCEDKPKTHCELFQFLIDEIKKLKNVEKK